jgi:hypothetical protein
VADAEVRSANLANGERWRVTTSRDGRYAFEQLSPGGPYRLEVRAIGFAPAARDGVLLRLNERVRLDVTLTPQIPVLEPLVARAEADPLIGPERTGPAQVIPESTLVRLPLQGRDLIKAALLSPLATAGPGGVSIAGQNARLTTFEVDGVAAGDLLGGVTPPGQDLGARALALEALQELQVLPAPFDVRYGTSAGLVHAITRSGSNRLEGEVWGYYTSRHLQSRNAAGDRGDDPTGREAGLTLGGPIARDRAAVFLEAGLQHYTFPTSVPVIGLDTTGGADSLGVGFRLASARRLQDILRERYGLDAGTAGAYPLDLPAANLFVKVTLYPRVNSRLELSHAYDASTVDFLFNGCRIAGTIYCLSSSAFRLPVRSHATRLSWVAAFGPRLSNELLIARRRYAQRCETGTFPTLFVAADAGVLQAGANEICRGDRTVQHMLELTDDVTLGAGSHRLIIGTHDELVRIPIGEVSTVPLHAVWHFGSLDSLEAGLPDSYEAVAADPARAGTRALADIAVEQVGMYFQDRFALTDRLLVTAGLRADVPFVSRHPTYNPALAAAFGLDNARTPAAHLLWAPRLGVSYGLGGNGQAFVRGGIGWFTGRPAYRWFGEVYLHTGLDAVQIACNSTNVPAFTPDLAHQPTACAGAAAGDAIAGPIMVFDPAFRFPRTFKLSLGGDAHLAGGLIATADLLYTRGTSQLDLRDRNLAPSTAAARGEGGRPLYGTIGADGTPTPSRLREEFGRVVELGSAGGDRSLAVTLQLQKRLRGGATMGASYTYTDARDFLSATEDGLDANLDATIARGSLEPRLAPSAWSVPHRVTLLVAADLPLHVGLTLFYEGRSGTPFTYTVRGDANADSYANDPVYVPADATPGGEVRLVGNDGQGGTGPAPDSTYAELDRFIRSQGCLREQRGRLLARNSCRNPWTHAANARLSSAFRVGGRRTLAVTLDVFNLLHLLNGGWGLARTVDDTPLLELAGYDPAGGRGVYRFLPRSPRTVNQSESRWRMQLGARVTF